MGKKSMKKKPKAINGKLYAAADEIYDRKMMKKAEKDMTTPGIANELLKAQKQMSYSKKPKVKPQRKK